MQQQSIIINSQINDVNLRDALTFVYILEYLIRFSDEESTKK